MTIKKTISIDNRGKDEIKRKYKKYNTLKKTDKELVNIIQNQYNDYREGGHWKCDCGRKIYFKKVMKNTSKKVILKVKCTKCKETIERFITKNKEQEFFSAEFRELLNRYKAQLKNDCNNFKLEDPDDMYGDMNHRFFIAVMTYNGASNFFTYLTNLVKRRFEDFERMHSRACRTTAVQCQCCGRWTGAITRNHLMMNKNSVVEGFPGHGILHDKIINEYGRDKFNLLDDENTKILNSQHWEGNDYNKTQRQHIKSNIVQAYREMFPKSAISISNVYMSDKDPETETEYMDMIPDNKSMSNTIDGFIKYNENIDEHFFVADDIPSEIKDMCKSYAYEIGEFLHNKFKNVRKVKKFKYFSDKESFINMLGKTFALILLGYTLTDICEVEDFNLKELKFWMKQIKSTKEIQSVVNFR